MVDGVVARMNLRLFKIPRLGFLSAFVSTSIGILLLVLNGALVVALYSGFVMPNTWLSDLRVAQLIFFVGPIVLLVLERLLFDLLVDGASIFRQRYRQ